MLLEEERRSIDRPVFCQMFAKLTELLHQLAW
jgi:hypothetical protein